MLFRTNHQVVKKKPAACRLLFGMYVLKQSKVRTDDFNSTTVGNTFKSRFLPNNFVFSLIYHTFALQNSVLSF